MQFSELLSSAGLRWRSVRGQALVDDVQSDSRRCGRGCCFVAVRGSEADGHRFIPAAIAAGASAVVCEDASAVPASVACAVVDSTHQASGLLAQAIRQWPSRKLINIGVTGTKGKSTTTYLVRSVLEAAAFRPALLGTISYETGKRTIPAPNTTPDSVMLAEMTAEMVADGRTHLVMEVSSHALDQCRTAGNNGRIPHVTVSYIRRTHQFGLAAHFHHADSFRKARKDSI